MSLRKKNKIVLLAIISFLIFLALGFYLKNLRTTVHNNLKVVLTAKVAKDDMFQLFYLDKDEERFRDKKSIKVELTGDKEFQKIVFDLPRLSELYKLRLDIGNNENQDPIYIQGIKFLMDSKEISINADSFDNLFRANNYIKKFEIKGKYQGLMSKGKKKNFFDPYFVIRQSSKEIKSLKSQKTTRFPFMFSSCFSIVFFLFLFYNLESISITTEKIFIFVFFAIIVAPTFQSNFKWVKPAVNLEQRTLAKKPQFEFSKVYSKNYEAYFSDNFGFRNRLINWGGCYRTKLFRSSMHSDLVKFGKEDWLFYNRIDGKIFGSYTNSNLLTKDTLQKIVAKWEQNKNIYNEKGIKYFLTFWPNKHTIYPEHLPNTMKTQIKDTLSRVDQILHYLDTTKSPVSLFDPRPFLIESKKSHQLYHKYDTHWNDYGAFIGYQSFLNENFSNLGVKPKNKNDFKITWNDFEKGELIQMLGVKNDDYFNEKAPTFELKDKRPQIEFLTIDGFPKQTKRTRNKYCGNKLKVLVFRDSFTTKLIQFLSLHFYEVTYIWGHGERYVDELEPDIIIEGYVERGTANKIQ